MTKKRYAPEQIVVNLRDAMLNAGKGPLRQTLEIAQQTPSSVIRERPEVSSSLE